MPRATIRTIRVTSSARAAMIATITRPGTASTLAVQTCAMVPATNPVRLFAHGRV
jgi:hypothetical protein